MPHAAGLCLAALGMYPSNTIVVTWLAANTRDFTRRGTGNAVTNGITHEIVAEVLQILKTSPCYFEGRHVALSLLAVMIPIVALGALYVRWLK
jgi:hypothetical protein